MKRNHALAVQARASGLWCDRPGCGHIQMGPVLNAKSITALIGTPCPKCGDNLLTKEDARIVIVSLRIVAVFNFLFFPLMLIQQILHLFGKKRPKDHLLRVETNGKGELSCTLDKEELP